MAIRVLFFAFAAERMKTRETEIPAETGTTVADVFARYEKTLGVPMDRFLFSVNDDWAPPERPLQDGDVLALIPPMAGGE